MNSLTILSKTIRQDEQGRFCLNDCHKASGGENHKRPSKWLSNEQAQDLITELAGNYQSPNSGFEGKPPFFEVVKTIRGGAHQGTYVVRELVYAYAMWISPSFHLKVIRAFDAMMRQPVAPVVKEPAQQPDLLEKILKRFGDKQSLTMLENFKNAERAREGCSALPKPKRGRPRKKVTYSEENITYAKDFPFPSFPSLPFEGMKKNQTPISCLPITAQQDLRGKEGGKIEKFKNLCLNIVILLMQFLLLLRLIMGNLMRRPLR